MLNLRLPYQCLLLFLAGTLCYLPSLNGGPVFDDKAFVFESVEFISTTNPFDFWLPESRQYKSWPLSYSAMWVMFQSFGHEYHLYKVVNILLHAFNALLALFVLRHLTTPWVAFISALIFAVHPFQVETVSWIFQIKTILGTLFCLCTFLFFFRYSKTGAFADLAGTVYCFFFSLVSKPLAILAPFLLLGMQWRKRKKVSLLFLGVASALALVSGLATLRGVENHPGEGMMQKRFFEGRTVTTSKAIHLDNLPLNSPAQPIFSSNSLLASNDTSEAGDQLLQILFSFGFYPVQFLAPWQLSLIYGKFTVVAQWVYGLLGLSFLLLCGLILRSQLAYGSIVSYVFAVLPVSGIAYVPYMKFSPVSDHWAYLAVIPLALLLASLCQHRRLARIGLLLWLALITYQCISYGKIFSHSTHVLERSLETAPGEFLLHIELSNLYIEQDRLDDAEAVLKEGLEHPDIRDNIFIMMQLGFVMRERGASQEELSTVLTPLADQLKESGYKEEAEKLYEEIHQSTGKK